MFDTETAATSWPSDLSQSAESASFNGFSEGNLYFQRCLWCQTPAFRRMLCPICRSPHLGWVLSKGTGDVQHTTSIFRDNTRQNYSMIHMQEGFSLRARVIGVTPSTVHRGMRVRLDTDTSTSLDLAFRPHFGPQAGG